MQHEQVDAGLTLLEAERFQQPCCCNLKGVVQTRNFISILYPYNRM